MEPKISKRGKKLHLSYELPYRIHCSRHYPVVSWNGSNVILYGHDRGLSVLWRGGRRLKEQSAKPSGSHTNGTRKSREVIVIDGDDEDETQAINDTDYEAEEEEQDPDCPFPSIIQDINIDLGTDVRCMAVPSMSFTDTSNLPDLARTHVIVALGCSNAKVMLLTIPLAPPRSNMKQHFIDNEINELQLEADGTVANDITIKVIANDDDTQQPTQGVGKGRKDISNGRILVAALTASLNFWSIELEPGAISRSANSLPQMHSPISGSAIAFQSAAKSLKLILADRAGAVRVYDAFAPRITTCRPSSRESASAGSADNEALGRWIMSYHTPYHSQSDNALLARRKKILAAAWVMSGQGILVLLEDGEWGVWDLTGPTQTGKRLEEFALRGYLDPSSTTNAAESSKQGKTSSKLAPMTPNTRKSKAENLFGGFAKAPGVASSGGISVGTINNRSGQADESVVMWYEGEVYSIPSLQSFLQRSTSGVATSGFGSLYTPGLIHISDVNLLNENITSISQITSQSTPTSFGKINLPHDLLISAEHRFVILQTLRPPGPGKDLFKQQGVDRPTSRDQRMLDVGELDLGGVDRMLESLVGDGKPRRVGFAH